MKKEFKAENDILVYPVFIHSNKSTDLWKEKEKFYFTALMEYKHILPFFIPLENFHFHSHVSKKTENKN